MAKRKKNPDLLHRAVNPWKISLTEQQLEVLMGPIGRNLREDIWNINLRDYKETNQRIYEEFLKPVYAEMTEGKKRAEEAGFSELWDKQYKDVSDEVWGEKSVPSQFIVARRKLINRVKKIWAEYGTNFIKQNYARFARRKRDLAFAEVPDALQEGTLKTLYGAYASYLVLKGASDPDAKPPKERVDGMFYTMTARGSFGVSKQGKLWISVGDFGDKMFFEIPDYQKGKLLEAQTLVEAKWETAIRELVAAGKEDEAKKLRKVKPSALRSFTLSRRRVDNRDKKEPDISKSGEFWVSVSYGIPKPPAVEFDRKGLWFLAVGDSFIGIDSPGGQSVIKLWRSDRHWMPKIAEVEAQMARLEEIRVLEGRENPSRKWTWLNGKRRNMYRIMGKQQEQNRREIAKKICSHRVHIVVTKEDVRSKPGKLADASKPERVGFLGKNWDFQNTGSLAYLIQCLQRKAEEFGGSVRKHKLAGYADAAISGLTGREMIPWAQKLREDFLAHQK